MHYFLCGLFNYLSCYLEPCSSSLLNLFFLWINNLFYERHPSDTRSTSVNLPLSRATCSSHLKCFFQSGIRIDYISMWMPYSFMFFFLKRKSKQRFLLFLFPIFERNVKLHPPLLILICVFPLFSMVITANSACVFVFEISQNDDWWHAHGRVFAMLLLIESRLYIDNPWKTWATLENLSYWHR